MLLFFCSGTLDQVTKLVVVIFSIGFLMGTILKFWKNARRKMIEICLVKSASTSVAC